MFEVENKFIRSIFYIGFLMIHIVLLIVVDPMFTQDRVFGQAFFYLSFLGVTCYYIFLLRKINQHHKLTVNPRFKLLHYKWLPFLAYVAYFLWSLFFVHETSSNQKALVNIMEQTPVAMILQAVVFAPLAEEVLVRQLFAAYFFPRLDKLGQVLLYIGLSSSLFSILHIPDNFLQFSTYFFMGCVFSISYVNYRDVRASIGMHFLHNFIVTLIMLLIH